ncbi:type I-E CRISPR-associated protein Cse2/CasB [Streptomyces radicis]|uniref:type I-E CRISPR-associated protein Cse2/CasB n=1 Tax=Streptomyces radicis TaxID=1750517 RepID=UPI001E502632|nr:type I-E CRISPR-associated protein Cse2/CasB [Streptomyces radicis]
MTTTASSTDDRAAEWRKRRLEYVEWIEKTCSEDPGARVALRAGLRQNINARSTFAMNRYIARWLSEKSPDSTQRAYFTVAALIASQPRSVEEAEETGEDPEEPERWGSSLGTAFAEAVAEAPGRDREMRESAAESRLNMLTRQSADGIHRSLPASVLYLRQLDVPIDWAQLLADLIAWPDHSGRIARRWLQDYYRRRHHDGNTDGEDNEDAGDFPEQSDPEDDE